MNCKGPFQKCKFNLFHILEFLFKDIDLFCNMQCVFELLKSEFMENLFSDYGRLKFFALPL